MSTVDTPPPIVFRPQLAALSLFGSWLVALVVFLSGFVIAEPAPYELFLVVLIGLWALFGLKISRYVAPLLTLLTLFMIGGILSLMTMVDLTKGPMYMAVSGFLALSAVFYAAIIEDRYQRLRLIFNAWVTAAVLTALLGILGYFGAIPGAENFTLYDRAKGAFQDPNVFGPFLVGSRTLSNPRVVDAADPQGPARRSPRFWCWRSACSCRSRVLPGRSTFSAWLPSSS